MTRLGKLPPPGPSKVPAFHLGKIWVTGRIDFEPGLADIVRVQGDLRMTVDGRDVPGFATYDGGVSINDWLRQLHNLLYPGDIDLVVTTRDLKDEQVRFHGKGNITFLRVMKPNGRAMPEFDKIPLDREQLVTAVCSLERRIRDLLRTLTTPEHAAAWWEGVTFVPMERAGVPVVHRVPRARRTPKRAGS